ncbi:MAG: NlpC/P60 family protein [Gaiellaceae bacterium]
MSLRRSSFAVGFAVLASAGSCAAASARPVLDTYIPQSWAAREIRAVTADGVLGTSPASFRPQASLTQSALAQAIATTESVLNPPPVVPTVWSTVTSGVTLAGAVSWVVAIPQQSISEVDFLVDGSVVDRQDAPPYTFGGAGGTFDTTKLSDGAHQLGMQFVVGDVTYTASWPVTVTNAPGTFVPPLSGAGQKVPITPPPPPPPPPPTLYKATSPAHVVSIKELDAALVTYLGLADAAAKFQGRLATAGLQPPAGTGSEIVARLLGLRLNHPANEDSLELLPWDAATRAEAAYSFAHVLSLDSGAKDAVNNAANAFTVAPLNTWQTRILRTAVSYVGYPYVWGGTSPSRETEFGVTARGGFDCSGFVWRVYKLTSYPGERGLAATLRGRTTYQMSGEVGPKQRIHAAKLRPADVLFFGNGARSSPNVVDHTGIYLGEGWMIQSSDEGVTIVPFDGWYTHGFAWARRPLHEAGLN